METSQYRAGPWSSHIAKSVNTYVVCSSSGGDLRWILTKDSAYIQAKDKGNVLEDVELTLREAGRPIAEQAAAIATALSDGGAHNTLADYAVALLAAGSNEDTTQLSRVLQGVGALAFSDFGKFTVILYLDSAMRTEAPVSDNFIQVYANIAIRYFILDASEGPRGPLAVQHTILMSSLPLLKGDERGSAALRSLKLSPTELAVLRKEMRRRQADGSGPEWSKEMAAWVLALYSDR